MLKHTTSFNDSDGFIIKKVIAAKTSGNFLDKILSSIWGSASNGSSAVQDWVAPSSSLIPEDISTQGMKIYQPTASLQEEVYGGTIKSKKMQPQRNHFIEESWSNGYMPIEIPILVDSNNEGPFLTFVSTNYDSVGVTSEVMAKETAEFMDSIRKLPEGKIVISSKKGDSKLKVIAILPIPNDKYSINDIRSSIDVTEIEDGKVKVKDSVLSLNGLFSIFSPPEIRY
ncbi:hypothetical protein EsVE80_17860 [Enterococcus saigonensis]|uniref:Uncharacterized protein n=1 Tax=Enterococcus saigonensis TaxID=1805431 RepID=A0A679IDD5_9ENTE|nr:hypothetical protein [Enterococcus saigonensis]BCA86263.1 hypothetical protein EsVE80_17860 [Enterococcus saigonensis]